MSLEDGAAERSGILIVDDLAEQRLVLETILADLDQELVSVRSGSEALREVLRREFALILLDVNMPDIDGFETATLIRRYKRSAHTPIIFVTAYADEMQTERGYLLGAVDYILTPVVPEVLRSKVKVFIDLHQMQRQARRQADQKVALIAAEAARSVAEQNTRRSSFLARASRALSTSLDLQVARCALLEQVVPEITDTAALALVGDDGAVAQVLLCHLDESGARRLEEREFAELAPPMRDVLTRVLTVDHPPARSIDAQAAASLTAVPLAVADRLLGALAARLDDSPETEKLLHELAGRAAIAFDNARLYRALQIEVGERHAAEAQLTLADRRKDEFLAMLAHELRNPLAPIRSALDVVRRVAPAEPKLAWAADVTERQVRQLARLIDELLDVARISQGKIELQLQSIDLLDVMSASIETMRPQIELRRQLLTQSLTPGPIVMRGDATRLGQVISNLLHNAVKYSDEGGHIHVAVAVADGQATITVRDNGIGIEPELLPQVFELFRQGERTLDRAQGGLGVGLTLAQRLVQLHHGRIEVTSAGIGAGAEFRIVLPCLTEVTSLAAVDDLTLSGQRHACCRVLIVEDNADAAETMAACLELAGHQVKIARDGVQAIECAPVFAPEVIVLDIGLPMMDGFELAPRLRRINQTQASLLIALTGYGQDADRERARQVGFDHYLVKPASLDDLTNLIGRWKNDRATSHSGRDAAAAA